MGQKYAQDQRTPESRHKPSKYQERIDYMI